MEIIWAVCLTALLIFCFRRVYFAGYKAGAQRVVGLWKQTINDMEEIKND